MRSRHSPRRSRLAGARPSLALLVSPLLASSVPASHSCHGCWNSDLVSLHPDLAPRSARLVRLSIATSAVVIWPKIWSLSDRIWLYCPSCSAFSEAHSSRWISVFNASLLFLLVSFVLLGGNKWMIGSGSWSSRTRCVPTNLSLWGSWWLSISQVPSLTNSLSKNRFIFLEIKKILRTDLWG